MVMAYEVLLFGTNSLVEIVNIWYEIRNLIKLYIWIVDTKHCNNIEKK